MARNGQATRERLLEAANELVLRHGFAATSLEQILKRTGVTKGAFFHHFPSKDALALALVDRYLEEERRLEEATLKRAERLTSDPLQQVLIAIGLLEEMFAGLDAPHPGCLVASYLYQNDLMTPEITARTRKAFAHWREVIAAKLSAAARQRTPRIPLDYEALGDLPNTLIEGALILSKLYDNPKFVAGQLRLLRNWLEVLFGAEAPPEKPAAGMKPKDNGRKLPRRPAARA